MLGTVCAKGLSEVIIAQQSIAVPTERPTEREVKVMGEYAAISVPRSDDVRNCWEFMVCGKEQNCPAFPDFGRACFAVTGTRCKGKEQGSYALKISHCRSCGFYGELMGGG